MCWAKSNFQMTHFYLICDEVVSHIEVTRPFAAGDFPFSANIMVILLSGYMVVVGTYFTCAAKK